MLKAVVKHKDVRLKAFQRKQAGRMTVAADDHRNFGGVRFALIQRFPEKQRLVADLVRRRIRRDDDVRRRAFAPIAPRQNRDAQAAQIAKDGKFADLDFIIVGWFGLLCVKCIGLGGQIYGNPGDPMWLQVDAEKRISFENPMRAAEADTRLVRDTLFTANLRGIQVETVCVFTNKKATLALPRGTGHYTLKDFKALLGKSKYEQDKGVDIPQTVDAVKKWVVEG